MELGDIVRKVKESRYDHYNKVGDIGVITQIDGKSYRVTVKGRTDFANWNNEEDLELVNPSIKIDLDYLNKDFNNNYPIY